MFLPVAGRDGYYTHTQDIGLGLQDTHTLLAYQSLLMRLCWGLMCLGGEKRSLRPRS